MSGLLALSAAHYINLKNNALLNTMRINNARMGMLTNPSDTTGSIGCCSLESLCAMDTQMELDALTNNLQYLYAKAMLESIEKRQKEEAKRFSLFA